jgi:transcriptional regulator with XRE-family HTH domain
MADQGPVVQRALLTAELLRLRHAVGLKQEDVASALEWSTSKLIRIEGGTVGMSITDLTALLRQYGVTDKDQVDELTKLARGARGRGWWNEYKNDVEDQAFLTFLGYEAGASVLRQSQGLLIPGLLQTEEYARALMSKYVEPSAGDALVEIRMRRQEEMSSREKPPQQFYVIDEAVIQRRMAESNDHRIMARQLRHLIEVAGRPDVTLELIPFTVGPHFGMKGPFALLEFDGDLGDVLYLESARRGDLVVAGRDPQSAELITVYQEAFNQLRSLSLGAERSVEVIDKVAKAMSE